MQSVLCYIIPIKRNGVAKQTFSIKGSVIDVIESENRQSGSAAAD